MEDPLVKKRKERAAFVTEFVGTMMLVFTVALNEDTGNVIAPLPIGAMLTGLVYMGGQISGAHYNPAVSLALFIRRQLSTRTLILYTIAQLLGAIIGSLSAYGLTFKHPSPGPGEGFHASQAVAVEIAFTFILVLVILNVATTTHIHSSFAGLAVGFTVLGAAFAAGPISGGVLNPALGTGLLIVHGFAKGSGVYHLWIYWVGPTVGALMAVAVFQVTHPAGAFHHSGDDTYAALVDAARANSGTADDYSVNV